MPDQTPLNPEALEMEARMAHAIMWKKLPFGGKLDRFIQLDANAAYAVIELLEPILAALPAAQPVVTSAKELDALPKGTVVRDAKSWIIERRSDVGWMEFGFDYLFPTYDIALPATVLHTPEGS